MKRYTSHIRISAFLLLDTVFINEFVVDVSKFRLEYIQWTFRVFSAYYCLNCHQNRSMCDDLGRSP